MHIESRSTAFATSCKRVLLHLFFDHSLSAISQPFDCTRTCICGITTVARINASKPVNPYGLALALLSFVFFSWGFLTSLNSVLIPHLQQVFNLTYTQSMLIQAVFFSGPLLVSLPIANLMKSIGYKNALIAGLVLVVLGTLMFYPATVAFSFPLVLVAVFITALGVAALQVVANPFVAYLGDSKTASSRLTMTSGINSLGTTVAPYLGAVVLFSATSLNAYEQAALIQGPYLVSALVIATLAIVIKNIQLPEPPKVEQQINSGALPAWRYRHLLLGLFAIFCYTGAEVGIGSFLVGYLSDANLGGLDRATAGKMVTFYWGGAMVGRLAGSILFRYLNARKVMAINALLAMIFVMMAILLPGRMGGWFLIAVGLCNSIMYPVIFFLALDKLGASTAQASGLLVMAGVGGAVLPMVQALVADQFGLSTSLLIPAISYAAILSYSVVGWKPAIINASEQESRQLWV